MSRQRPVRNNTGESSTPPPSAPNPALTAPIGSQQTAQPTNGSQTTRRDFNVKTPTFLGRFGAIELENKGSVARDHLALERTFLAWLRTSLAFASIGIAVTQLFRLNATLQSPDSSSGIQLLAHLGKSLGATFLGISILVLAIGAQRYYESQGWLLKGKFPASRGSVFAVTLIALLVGHLERLDYHWPNI